MAEIEEKIQEEMRAVIVRYSTETEMFNYLYRFIEHKTKECYPFGKLVVAHYYAFGGKSEEVYKAAAAVELVILSLDIFDDLQDQDNDSTPWSQIAPAVSMNLATGLLALGTHMLCDIAFEAERKMAAISFMNSLVANAVAGQHKDITNMVHSEEEYIQVTREKSGSLLSMPCLVGTALATPEHYTAVREYAEHIGIAAQIHNDINDITRWDKKNDLLHRKKTLPALYFLRKNEKITKYYEGEADLHEILADKHSIMSEMKESGAIEYAQVIARVHLYKALDLIKALDIPADVKESLLLSLNLPQIMAGNRKQLCVNN